MQEDVAAKVFQGLAQEVHRRTGVTIDAAKSTMLSSRIRRRTRALGLEGPAEYLKVLKGLADGAAELEEFIDVVTTHKTSFFRTRSVWDWLRANIGPDGPLGPRVRAWSAASSHGHEAFSMALLFEDLKRSGIELGWSVRATDVSPIAAARAATGTFSVAELGAVPDVVNKSAVDRAFQAAQDGQRAARASVLRDMSFGTHNLLDRMDDTFDLILLRNVLIYFTDEDRARVIRNVTSALRTGGVLVIGESESLVLGETHLEYQSPCIYRCTR